jgi:hypothetical protein
MKPDDQTRRIQPAEDPGEAINIGSDPEIEAVEAQQTEPTGWAALLRRAMQRSGPGEVRTNIKRQQLKEDRTKSFLLLAGLTVVLSLGFFAMFSTPNTGRKDTARVDHPNPRPRTKRSGHRYQPFCDASAQRRHPAPGRGRR